MKRIYLFLLIFSLIVSSYSREKIPEWFKKLPEISGVSNISTGYTGKFNDKKLARQVARYRAEEAMAKQIKLRLIFEFREVSGDHYRLIDPTFQQIFYEEVLNRVKNNSVVIDSSFIEGRYYILLGYNWSGENKIQSDTVNWGKKPRWTASLPDEEKYIYGIGMVGNYSSWKKGWQDADEYARFAACKNQKVATAYIRKEKRIDEYTTKRSVSQHSVDTTLYNSTIIERWYDIERDMFYSLCRIPAK